MHKSYIEGSIRNSAQFNYYGEVIGHLHWGGVVEWWQDF